jgi:hypothetical protein
MHVLINYFNPKATSSLRKMAQTALALFHENSSAKHLLHIVDGSGFEDAMMKAFCHEIGAFYHPSRVIEGFARTYNRALDIAGHDASVICASDIFVPRGWDSFLTEYRDFEGMIIPYLSCSDYSTQQLQSDWARRPIAPVSCTINLNYFSPGVIQKIGTLDETFTGGYNDVDLLIRLRRAGMEVLMVDMGPVKHLGKMTVSVATTWNNAHDRERFFQKYPHLASRRWWYSLYNREICRNPALALMLWFAQTLAPLSLLSKLIVFEIFFNNRPSKPRATKRPHSRLSYCKREAT